MKTIIQMAVELEFELPDIETLEDDDAVEL